MGKTWTAHVPLSGAQNEMNNYNILFMNCKYYLNSVLSPMYTKAIITMFVHVIEVQKDVKYCTYQRRYTHTASLISSL